MPDLTSTLARLDELAEELTRRGESDLAEQARSVASDVRTATVASELMSTSDAAAMLSVRSINTVKRWAREGLLEGFQVGGRVKVTRASVERLLNSAMIARQQAYEQDLAEVLDAFDVGDGPVPQSELPHIGRAPWDSVADQKP